MTINEYKKAEYLIGFINKIDRDIEKLEKVLKDQPEVWIMEIRKTRTFSSETIDHDGFLPEILKMILERKKQARAKAEAELGKI